MTSVATSGSAGALLLGKLFGAADTDKNEKVSAGELDALIESLGGTTRGEDLIAPLDTDGDGALSAADLPSNLFADETLASLIDMQAYRSMSREERAAIDDQIKRDFFARVDLDGDGQLSAEEIEADRAMTLANTLDTGEAPAHIAMVQPGEDGQATIDDIFVAHRLDPGVAIKAEEMDPAMRAQFERMREAFEVLGAPPNSDMPAPPTEAEVRETQLERLRATETTSALLTRLIAQLSDRFSSQPAQPTTDIAV